MSNLVQKGRCSWMKAALAAVFLASGALAGCSSGSGEEEPQECEESEECPEGFSCNEGICVEGAVENEGEGPPPIEEEEYQFSYLSIRPGIGADLPPSVRLRYFSSKEGEGQELLTEELEAELQCARARECRLTPNQEYLVAVKEGEELGEYDILTVGFDATEAKLVGPPQKVLEGVLNPRLRGDGVIFDRVEDEVVVAYYREFGASQDVRVATLAHTESNPPQYWDADPVSDRAVVYIPTLESMDLRVGTISGGVSANNQITSFGRNNYPGDAGSLYVGQHPVGFSPDGRYVAIYLEAPVAHGSCQSNSDCQGTSHVCGSENRCVALEVALHIIDMENIVTLDDPCNSDDMCGPVHRCDSGAANLDGGRCMPQVVVAGVPHLPHDGDPPQSGCEATRADGSYSFTELRGPFTYGPDGRFYLVARRDCVKGDALTGDSTEANIARASIIAIDPETGEVEEVYGNSQGDDFDDTRCYDEASREIVTDNCVIDIKSAQLSPEGNEVVFVGSNPGGATPQVASQSYDLWRVRRDGEDHQWVGKGSTQFPLHSFTIHPPVE